MFAYDYPLLGFFWTVFILMLWIWWLFLLFRIIFDIFRRRDIGGWGKAGWLIDDVRYEDNRSLKGDLNRKDY